MTHKSHNMRYSDSSQYDFICDECMQPDWSNRNNPHLDQPCVGPARGGLLRKPFKSDGCSMVPDRNSLGCCEDHDEDYWRGGPLSLRLPSDNRLFYCVQKKDGTLWAWVCWIGTRIGGHPLVPAGRWRWGYGYPYPRWNP